MNSLTPAYTILRYHVGTHRHTMTFACRTDSEEVPGEVPNVLDRAGTSILWDSAVSTFVNLLKPMFSAASGFDLAEIWSHPTPTAPTQFIDAIQLGVAGTNGAAALPAGEAVFTFRTAHRGGFKLYLMEPSVANNQKLQFPLVDSPVQNAIADYVTGSGGWLIARNDDYPLAALNFTTKQNDVLRDKYLIGG